jgi:hypothetical protein
MNETVFSEVIPELLSSHFRHLNEGSSISVNVIKERGYRSLLGKSDLEKLGFSPSQCRTPGLLIPLWGVDSTGIIGHQFRPDSPRLNSKSKPIKYENPRGTSVRLDTPPACRASLGNPNIPIWFVEGVKKADSLASRGECVITLTGVWNFKGKNSLGGVAILADFDYIALKDRECYICFDSDYRDNPSVSKAAARLAEHLSRRDTRVSIVYLPAGEQGEKVGVDDFLSQGHNIDELKALAVPVENKDEENKADEVFTSHFDNKGLWLEVKKFDGSYAFAHINGTGGVPHI